jgi:hypothetical protein
MDLHRVAQIVKGNTPAGARSSVRLRQGTVVTDNEDGTCDVTLAGSETVLAGVVHFSDVTPVEGSAMWFLTDGVDLIGIGVT